MLFPNWFAPLPPYQELSASKAKIEEIATFCQTAYQTQPGEQSFAQTQTYAHNALQNVAHHIHTVASHLTNFLILQAEQLDKMELEVTSAASRLASVKENSARLGLATLQRDRAPQHSVKNRKLAQEVLPPELQKRRERLPARIDLSALDDVGVVLERHSSLVKPQGGPGGTLVRTLSRGNLGTVSSGAAGTQSDRAAAAVAAARQSMALPPTVGPPTMKKMSIPGSGPGPALPGPPLPPPTLPGGATPPPMLAAASVKPPAARPTAPGPLLPPPSIPPVRPLSSVLPPPGPPPAPPPGPPPPPGASKFSMGQSVQAKYAADGQFYAAKVKQTMPGGKYVVTYTEYAEDATVSESDIKGAAGAGAAGPPPPPVPSLALHHHHEPLPRALPRLLLREPPPPIHQHLVSSSPPCFLCSVFSSLSLSLRLLVSLLLSSVTAETIAIGMLRQILSSFPQKDQVLSIVESGFSETRKEGRVAAMTLQEEIMKLKGLLANAEEQEQALSNLNQAGEGDAKQRREKDRKHLDALTAQVAELREELARSEKKRLFAVRMVGKLKIAYEEKVKEPLPDSVLSSAAAPVKQVRSLSTFRFQIEFLDESSSSDLFA